MQGLRRSFVSALLFALLTMVASRMAAAQDMPPILAPLAPAAAPSSPPVSPSAEAAIPPKLTERPAVVPLKISPPAVLPPAHATASVRVAAAPHNASGHHTDKFAALMKRLSVAHAHPATHRVVVQQVEPSLPRGMPMPPPGYYGPSPYEHLVYGGPPPSVYGGWGYRGRSPYYP
jgi:hypothetical protein